MERTYEEAESGEGAVYEWSGNRRAGVGRMVITDTTEDQRVTIDLRFVRPFRSSSTTTFSLEEASGGTDVTWTMTGPMTLTTRIMGLFASMDRMVGPDFEKGLARLKADAEG